MPARRAWKAPPVFFWACVFVVRRAVDCSQLGIACDACKACPDVGSLCDWSGCEGGAGLPALHHLRRLQGAARSCGYPGAAPGELNAGKRLRLLLRRPCAAVPACPPTRPPAHHPPVHPPTTHPPPLQTKLKGCCCSTACQPRPCNAWHPPQPTHTSPPTSLTRRPSSRAAAARRARTRRACCARPRPRASMATGRPMWRARRVSACSAFVAVAVEAAKAGMGRAAVVLRASVAAGRPMQKGEERELRAWARSAWARSTWARSNWA